MWNSHTTGRTGSEGALGAVGATGVIPAHERNDGYAARHASIRS
jgi:hypothetical protein